MKRSAISRQPIDLKDLNWKLESWQRLDWVRRSLIA